MAASSPGQDVKDQGYRNWMKVERALCYMKRAFHSFIRNEVNLIHKYLINTIYGGTTVLYPKCTRCKASDIKQHKRTKAWGFITAICPALCHDWLTELLTLFDNPRSDRIYWSNCDVTSWAYNAWECAKAFMPRGQKPTNTDPKESDAQALLTRMANCKHFHRFFSPTGISQIHKVSDLRNSIVHASQNKLTDTEMRNFIQEIIDLLEDPVHLHSLPDCMAAVSDIKQIRDASVDVYLDLEVDIRALRDLQGVSNERLQQELDKQKIDLKSLHQELDCHTFDVDSTCQEIKSDLKAYQKDIDTHKSVLEVIQRDIDSHESELEVIHKDIDSQKSDLEVIHKDIDSQKSDLEVIHKDIDLHKSDLEVIHKELSDSGKTVSAHLTNLQQKVDTRLTTVQENVQSELKILECEFLCLREQVMASNKHSDPQDIREMQHLLIKAYESVQIVSISPVFDNAVNLKDLEDFYTDLVIEEERDVSAQRSRDEKQKITSFNQVFHKADKKVAHIILKAPAGQGKSTFCRKLVYTWCSVQKKKLNPLIDVRISGKSETNGLKDEDVMLRFDVLLYICLRDISNEKTLMDAVYTQFPLHESHGLSYRSRIEEMIGQAEENKVLLIMDGLDEMDNSSSFIKKIMKKRLYPHVTVLATTRPWKIDQLSLIRSADIDLLLNLRGFSYKNSKLFAERIFDKYYNDTFAIIKFVKNIKRNALIRSLINVPLLLLFIVHVWYEKKSFPQTIHELYMDILNVMVNRFMESKERMQESKESQDEKKHVLKTWQLESPTFVLTPKLRNLLLVQHFGEGFLASLCTVANHFLTTDANATSLVFEEEVFVELLGEDGLSKLQTAVDMGILSNSNSPGIFRKKMCLTFLHKTVQEFLATISICCREDKCKMFLDSLNTLDDVFKNENIIKFVAGICTSHCHKISERIYEICDHLGGNIGYTEMKYLCRLCRDCTTETCRGSISLKLHSLHAHSQCEWDVLQSALSNTRTWLKYLFLCNLNDVILDLSEFTSLTKLSFRYSKMSAKLLLSKFTHLKCMKLVKSSLYNGTFDLSESACLEHLSLVAVTLTGKLLLSKCAHLKYLILVGCNFDDATLDLSECTSLVEVNLEYVTFKGTLLVSKCTHLKHLTLLFCKLDDVSLHLSECTSLVEFRIQKATTMCKLLISKCSQIKCLILAHCSLDIALLRLSESEYLQYLSMENVTMRGKLLLSRCTHLESLELLKCNIDDASLDLSECYNLTELKIENVTMMSKLLLSKCTRLKCLKLVQCSLDIASLDLSESEYLQDLNIVTVTMKGKLLLSRCTHLESLKLVKCNVDDAAFKLSEFSSLKELILDNVSIRFKLLSKCSHLKCVKLVMCHLDDATVEMSKLTSLTKLRLEDVTMKGTILLSKCTHLEHLELKDCKLDDATLELSECTSLTELSFKCVAIKGKLLLSKCSHLKCLKMVLCRLNDAVLDLSECTSLTWLRPMYMTISGKVLLLKCTQLRWLEMMNCELGDTILDLSECTSLAELSFKYMTIKAKLLLSMCTQFRCLKLVRCTFADTVLDLSGYTSLTELSLKHVSMKGKLLLSKFINLKCLTLVRCNLNETTLDLSEPTTLTKVTLIHLIMDGKLLLSKCTHLTCLKLVRCNLDDATLDFSKFDNLAELSLEYVNIFGKLLLSKCITLTFLNLVRCNIDDPSLDLSECTSLTELRLHFPAINTKLLLSKCTYLTCLKLVRCNLDDATLDFSTFDSLAELSLEYVNINGKLLLSKCTHLIYLDLLRCNLDDALLDLSECTNLLRFKFHDVIMKGKLILSKCTQIRYLNLDGSNLDHASLDITGCSNLYELDVKDLIMKGKILLSKCSHLKWLKLVRCTLDHVSLDLSECISLNNVSLEYVTIKNKLAHCSLNDALSVLSEYNSVTMLGLEYVTMMGKLLLKHLNLTHCTLEIVNLDLSRSTCLKEKLDIDDIIPDDRLYLTDTVDLKSSRLNVKLDDGIQMCGSWPKCKQQDALLMGHVLFNLNNISQLHELTLDNVIMSKDSIEVLNYRLSHCEVIRTLSLRNLDLVDVILSLDNLKQLRWLIIDNVTMCKDGYVMLCKGISLCTQLRSLLLANLDLGDAVHSLASLDRLDELELVNITISLQCAFYIRTSVEHLMSLYHYSSAHTGKLIIVKAPDNCEKCVVNYTSEKGLDDADHYLYDCDVHQDDPNDYDDHYDEDDFEDDDYKYCLYDSDDYHDGDNDYWYLRDWNESERDYLNQYDDELFYQYDDKSDDWYDDRYDDYD